jgi:hypothetical protein
MSKKKRYWTLYLIRNTSLPSRKNLNSYYKKLITLQNSEPKLPSPIQVVALVC